MCLCVCVPVCVYSLRQTFTQCLLCQVLCESQGAQMGREGPPTPEGGGPQLIAPHLPSPRPSPWCPGPHCRLHLGSLPVLILNSIVLPHKELSRSFTNQIIL